MQRKIGTKPELDKTVPPYETIGASSAIDKTASNYIDASEKVQKVKKLMSTGRYDTNIAKLSLEGLNLCFRECWKISIQRKDEPIFLTTSWKTLIFKSY